MKADIVGWENERKLAATLRMEKKKVIFYLMTKHFLNYNLYIIQTINMLFCFIKSEMEKRREINNQHYKSKLARIKLIADGAKKQLEEKRRSKEAQVHEKVKKMRRTGKIPINYFCFRCY